MHHLPGWLETHWPFLNQEIGDEVRYNGFKERIEYHVDSRPISHVAYIDADSRIHLWENYLQLLWCVCYAQVSLYQEGWQKSVRGGNPVGYFDSSEPAVRTAYDVLDAGVSLIHSFDSNRFAALPRPIIPEGASDDLVTKANRVFLGAGVFIIMHEYAHHLFGHVSLSSNQEDARKHEFSADEFAFDLMKRGEGRGQDVDTINTLGIVATMTSFMLMHPTLEGGESHPDLHERYWNALDRLSLDGAENVWISACLGLQTWGRYHPVPVSLKDPFIPRSGREMFRDILDQIVQHQHPSFFH